MLVVADETGVAAYIVEFHSTARIYGFRCCPVRAGGCSKSSGDPRVFILNGYIVKRRHGRRSSCGTDSGPLQHHEQFQTNLLTKWAVAKELAHERRHLSASNHSLKAVLDSTGDAIWMFDVAGFLLFAN